MDSPYSRRLLRYRMPCEMLGKPVNQKQKVLQAIKELGHKVSAADIAAKTGLALVESRLLLNNVALETKAALEVSPGGEISYKFYPDLESIYKIVGLRKLALQLGKLAFDLGFFVLRISFGLLLIASVLTLTVVFVVALVFILFGVGAADAADGQMDGGACDILDFDFYDFDMLTMFFAWSVFAKYRTPNDQGDAEYLGMKIDTPDKGFFYNSFSFLFGEGNPNRKLEDEQWRCVAETIRQNSGVVTGAQLAPYKLKAMSESAFMLETMIRFDGSPEPSPLGNIVYVFPSMQISATRASAARSLRELPARLEEKDWKFSLVPIERLHWVFFFAGANLCGAYALHKHLSWFLPLQPYSQQVEWLLTYAMFFMGFPILRELGNVLLNSMIDLRNKDRADALKSLQSPENQLRINEAKEFAISLRNLSREGVFYTTEKDILPQDTDGLAGQFSGYEQNHGQAIQPSQGIQYQS